MYDDDADDEDDDGENDDEDDSEDDDPPQLVSAEPRRHTSANPAQDTTQWRDAYNLKTSVEKHVRNLETQTLITSALSTTTADIKDPSWAPRHFSQIKKVADVDLRNEWFKAHFAENDGLFEVPDVLKMVPLPPGVGEKDLMNLMTLYVVKSDGRKKARTVLGAGKGNLDADELGFDRTFSPTARASTVRMLCSVAAAVDWIIRGGDVKQAYSQANWPMTVKKVLSHIPCGYNKYYNGVLHCVEVGNLYGHPIAGRNWYDTIVAWLIAHGFTQSQHDPCLFSIQNGDDCLHLVLYVDDILTFSPPGSKLSEKFEKEFGQDFAWTSFGSDLHEYNSVRITQHKGKIELDMERYIDSMVTDAFPGGVHHAYSTPADIDLNELVRKAANAKDTTYAGTDIGKRMRRLTMQAAYLSQQARPDIACAVNLIQRVQAWPSPELLKRIERVVIYLHGSKALKLTYTAPESVKVALTWAPHVTIEGSSDANWEVGPSTSGYIIGLVDGGAPFAWGAWKQESTALSTQEAEIVAGSLAACDIVSERGIANDIGFPQTEPSILKMDSSSGIDLAYDPMYHSKAKHINRRDLFIRELVARKVVKPQYVPTSKNVADLLTKPLAKPLFAQHRSAILGLPLQP